MPDPYLAPLIRKIDPHVWEADHHLLYSTDEQATACEDLMEVSTYNSFHTNTITLMRENSAEICRWIQHAVYSG